MYCYSTLTRDTLINHNQKHIKLLWKGRIIFYRCRWSTSLLTYVEQKKQASIFFLEKGFFCTKILFKLPVKRSAKNY
ncbi:unnamed protein product [Adineta ricciae]|uniref:Uncharacterized protein n=1 Tax=Adineta ricciae TaxID=249248 RepID=A0A815SAW1_ADIRI|nr:unnamed protein product [Adineta ricciae]